jgi:hypothetical protein
MKTKTYTFNTGDVMKVRPVELLVTEGLQKLEHMQGNTIKIKNDYCLLYTNDFPYSRP